MSLTACSQLARAARPLLRSGACSWFFAISFCLVFGGSIFASGQSNAMPELLARANDARPGAIASPHAVRTRRFLGGRTLIGNVTGAHAMEAARQQHAAMLAQQAASPQSSSLKCSVAADRSEPGRQHRLWQRHGPHYRDCDRSGGRDRQYGLSRDDGRWSMEVDECGWTSGQRDFRSAD
jgi:hypothetical protein